MSTPPPRERRRRESDGHPCFPQPSDRSGTVWRYMSFPKFVSLLHNGMFFSRVDCLGDAWEGALPSGTADIFKAAADEIVSRGDASWLPEIKGSWTRSYGAARTRTYANCWQLAPRDVWWM